MKLKNLILLKLFVQGSVLKHKYLQKDTRTYI